MPRSTHRVAHHQRRRSGIRPARCCGRRFSVVPLRQEFRKLGAAVVANVSSKAGDPRLTQETKDPIFLSQVDTDSKGQIRAAVTSSTHERKSKTHIVCKKVRSPMCHAPSPVSMLSRVYASPSFRSSRTLVLQLFDCRRVAVTQN